MTVNWGDSALGFAVGFLLGMTGIGGGAVMTPLLVITGRAQPIIAVGTDLVWAMVTKSLGTYAYCKQKTVDFAIVRYLAAGSIPGSLLGILTLYQVRRHTSQQGLNAYVLRAVGVALILVSASIVARMVLKSSAFLQRVERLNTGKQTALTVAGGAVVGFLVALTSVGSGSLVLAMLMLLYGQKPVREIIGVDMLHSVVLAGVAVLGQWGIGSINIPLVARLLLGSLPGIWLGTKLNFAVPEKILRPVLASLFFAAGYKFL